MGVPEEAGDRNIRNMPGGRGARTAAEPPHENLVRAMQIAELLVLPIRPDKLSGDAGSESSVTVDGGQQISHMTQRTPPTCNRQWAILAAPDMVPREISKTVEISSRRGDRGYPCAPFSRSTLATNSCWFRQRT